MLTFLIIYRKTENTLPLENPEFLDNLSAFSISLWYYPLDDSRPGGKYESLLSRGEDGRCPNRSGEWSVGLYDARRAVFGHDNSVWAGPVSEVENWYHVVAVLDGDNYKIYWNGSLEEEETGNANCSNFRAAEDIGQLFVGAMFTGKIDDVLLYDRVLTANEINELYELDTCCN
ncbi:MAG: LamG domain-containing protein [Bacteroidota bacterium]